MEGVTTELVDASIAELRAIHDRLAGLDLSPEQLTGPSGASEWSVADVLSHLGSGAEINRYTLQGALGTEQEPPANQEVWDRWNALAPAEQAAGFLESDEALVALYEGLSPEQRASLQVDLGFLPQPVPLATALGMRLNEAALHAWDVEAGLDPAAPLSDDSAALLARHFTETMDFMLGFIGKAEGVGPTTVAVGDHAIVIDGEGVRLEAGTDGATATFEGPFEAGVRLLSGRLGPAYTPDGVSRHRRRHAWTTCGRSSPAY